MLSIPERCRVDHYKGEIEIEIRNRSGVVVARRRWPNLIKIFAKEMLAHRLPYSKVWDPTGGSGAGAWVSSDIDVEEEFAAKYILFGASFDENGLPLSTTDTRFYQEDPTTGTPIPVSLNVGADNDGDLINPIPISEPQRPLKKIESIYFESSYQPSDSPLLQSYVRAVNNVLVLETTLRVDEYNGMGTTDSDTFSITEIALAGGKALDTDIGACECVPHILFLEGAGGQRDVSIPVILDGGSTITIDSSASASDVIRIKEGDQIYLVDTAGSEETYDTMGQVSPYYLVVSKSATGRELTLDRTPADSSGNAIVGTAGIYRTTLRIFSHRILSVPFTKSADREIVCRWRIYFN